MRVLFECDEYHNFEKINMYTVPRIGDFIALEDYFKEEFFKDDDKFLGLVYSMCWVVDSVTWKKDGFGEYAWILIHGE